MGSAPSKVPRSRSGLSFVSTSSVSSLTTCASDNEDEPSGHESAENFTFDDVTTKSFCVKWSPPKRVDVASYQVRIFPPDKIKSRTLLRALPAPEYTFSRLHSGTSYSVAVIATKLNGERVPCSTAHVATLPRPPRNIEFPSQATSSAVEVTWRHSKGKRDCYEASIEPTEGVTSPCNVTNLTSPGHVFSGLVPGVRYTVSVFAVANRVRSEALVGEFTTGPRHVCDLIFAEVTQHELTVQWKAPEGKVEGYNLKLTQTDHKSNEPVQINKLTNLSYTFNGLVPGRLYDCTVTSVTLDTQSKPRTYTCCTIPSQASDVTAREIGPEEALVTWSPATGDVDDYDLFLTPKEGASCNTNPSGVKGTKYHFKGLVPGTTYKLGIVSNSKDKSSKRVVATFITEPGLSGDLDFVKEGSSRQKQMVKWRPSKGRADSYIVYARRSDKKEPSWKLDDVYSPECWLNDLTPGTSYHVDVTSLSDGRESSALSGTFATEPNPVSTLSFPHEGCAWDKVQCAWDKAEGGVESYKLTVKLDGAVALEKHVDSDLLSYTFTGLKPSTIYEFVVEVYSNSLLSTSVTGKHKTGPCAISNLRLEQKGKRELAAEWVASDGGADDYMLTIDSLGDAEPKLSTTCEETSTKHSFRDLTPGTQYRVGVTPRSRKICGPTADAEAYTKPGDVTNVHIPQASVSKDTIVLNWSGVEGNCRSMDITLTRIQKIDEDQLSAAAVIIKEEYIERCESGLNERIYDGLDEATIYGFRLRSNGEAGVGDDVVVTQATLSTKPEPPPVEDAKPPSPITLPKEKTPSPEPELLVNESPEPVVKLPEFHDKPPSPILQPKAKTPSPEPETQARDSPEPVIQPPEVREKTPSPIPEPKAKTPSPEPEIQARESPEPVMNPPKVDEKPPSPIPEEKIPTPEPEPPARISPEPDTHLPEANDKPPTPIPLHEEKPPSPVPEPTKSPSPTLEPERKTPSPVVPVKPPSPFEQPREKTPSPQEIRPVLVLNGGNLESHEGETTKVSEAPSSPQPSTRPSSSPKLIDSSNVNPSPNLSPKPSPKLRSSPSPKPIEILTSQPSPKPSPKSSPKSPTLSPNASPKLGSKPSPKLSPKPSPKPSPRPSPKPSPRLGNQHSVTFADSTKKDSGESGKSSMPLLAELTST